VHRNAAVRFCRVSLRFRISAPRRPRTPWNLLSFVALPRRASPGGLITVIEGTAGAVWPRGPILPGPFARRAQVHGPVPAIFVKRRRGMRANTSLLFLKTPPSDSGAHAADYANLRA